MLWGGFFIGFGLGLFLALGSAFIIGRTMKLLSTDDESWNMGTAIAISAIWISKIMAACLVIYLAQKTGFSTLYLGMGLPVGIIVGVLAVKKVVKT